VRYGRIQTFGGPLSLLGHPTLCARLLHPWGGPYGVPATEAAGDQGGRSHHTASLEVAIVVFSLKITIQRCSILDIEAETVPTWHLRY